VSIAVIHKYAVSVDGGLEVPWPCATTVTHVQVLDNPAVVHMWVVQPQVPPYAVAYRRWFKVVGTGHPFPDDAEVVGSTVHAPTGLEWHVVAYPPVPVR
jgi:hypothetical protein